MKGREVSTGDLLKGLARTADFKEYLNASIDAPGLPSFSEYIQEQCHRKGKTPRSIIKRSGIERTYGYQLFNSTRKPSRDKVLQLAIGFGLNVEETQNMLRIADKSILYPKIKRDAAILFCIVHEMGFAETQKALELYELQPLGE